MFIGTFFHLFAHDESGPLGSGLRSAVTAVVEPAKLGLSDRLFAVFVMNVFMQVTGIMRMELFLGPSFSPILAPYLWVVDKLKPTSGDKKKKKKKKKND